MHNEFFVLSPLGTTGERYALSAMPASMGPVPRAAQESLLGVCGCRRHLQRHRVSLGALYDSAKPSILCFYINIALNVMEARMT